MLRVLNTIISVLIVFAELWNLLVCCIGFVQKSCFVTAAASLAPFRIFKHDVVFRSEACSGSPHGVGHKVLPTSINKSLSFMAQDGIDIDHCQWSIQYIDRGIVATTELYSNSWKQFYDCWNCFITAGASITNLLLVNNKIPASSTLPS